MRGGKLMWYVVLAIFLMSMLLAKAVAQEEKNFDLIRRKVEIRRSIVVSIPDRKLALLENDRVVRIYGVAVGADGSPSPIGSFRISQRLTNPTYYHPHVVIPPGKDNPLGTRWIGLGLKGFGIHGTNAPRSIGRRASHGCIRMRRPDLEELFDKVRPGDVVEIHGERDAQVAAVFGEQPAVMAQVPAAVNAGAQ
ncbi:MAG TPA: L,D-transpeptidase [Terriglobales bacterium]|nr:L,D-transpeptidase [Terriglobales bacterium]